MRIAAIIRNSGLSLGRQGRPLEEAAPLYAAVRRNSNITTITIKSGGVGTRCFRADGERAEREGATGRRGRLLQEKTPLGRTERMQETSSRGVFFEPSPTYGLLPVYAPEDPQGGKETSAQMFLPRYFPGQERTKFPLAAAPPRRPLSTPRDTIVRRVNTFVDRENRRTLLH